MNSKYDKFTFRLIANAASLWLEHAGQPCPAGITSIAVMDQTVRAGP